jgi:FixJ family two-component response regulator
VRIVARQVTLLALGPTRQSTATGPIVPRMAQPLPWIAIVDDDPSVLKALARVLRTRAIGSRTYGSAREFLAALPDSKPDEMPECLILDLQMPDMNGLELQRHLNREGIAIPTIVITAHREADMRELCEAAGADTYLLKPLQDVVLLAAIDRARAKTAQTRRGEPS